MGKTVMRALAVAVLVLGVSACSISAGAAEVKRDALARRIGSTWHEQFPDTASMDMTCDGAIPAKVGATQRCHLKTPGGRLGITVTVDRVKGTHVHFDLKADAALNL